MQFLQGNKLFRPGLGGGGVSVPAKETWLRIFRMDRTSRGHPRRIAANACFVWRSPRTSRLRSSARRAEFFHHALIAGVDFKKVRPAHPPA